ncbi:MAG: zinc metalloprotease HtpX [Blastocatellia bacterium]|nr:zinc metalloprotease HtpX [Blastocatellia bacterium]
MMNRTKTFLLLAALTALFLFLGRAIGGQGGLIIAILIAGVMNFVSYWWSDKIVLRMYNAQEISEAESPELFAIVRELAQRANIPMPRVYLIPEETPNAFATGRNPQHAAVAVTVGLMRMLESRELAGVIAHELSHVLNRDTLIMTVAATLAGALAHLAQMAFFFGGRNSDDDDGGSNPLVAIFGMLVALIAAPLIQMAISRSREFIADETGARITNDPLALASALRKIESSSRQIPMQSGTPETAHLFIINPFSGGGIATLFSTHPSTQARIERLEAMAGHGALKMAV